MKQKEIATAKLATLKEVATKNKLSVKGKKIADFREAVTFHFFPKESDKDATLAASAKAKKKDTPKHQANLLAMAAIRGLVKSGSKAVTFKENKSGSVMWVKFHKVEKSGFENAVLANIMKAAKCLGKNYTASSVTLCASGSVCVWSKSN